MGTSININLNCIPSNISVNIPSSGLKFEPLPLYRPSGDDTDRARVDTGWHRVDTDRPRVDTDWPRVDTDRPRVGIGSPSYLMLSQYCAVCTARRFGEGGSKHAHSSYLSWVILIIINFCSSI